VRSKSGIMTGGGKPPDKPDSPWNPRLRASSWTCTFGAFTSPMVELARCYLPACRAPILWRSSVRPGSAWGFRRITLLDNPKRIGKYESQEA
jgi:hypothetical protein